MIIVLESLTDCTKTCYTF